LDKYVTQEFKQKLRDICLGHLSDNTTINHPDGWNFHSERLCRRDIKRELRRLSARLYYVQLKKDEYGLGNFGSQEKFKVGIHEFSKEFIRRLKCDPKYMVKHG